MLSYQDPSSNMEIQLTVSIATGVILFVGILSISTLACCGCAGGQKRKSKNKQKSDSDTSNDDNDLSVSTTLTSGDSAKRKRKPARPVSILKPIHRRVYPVLDSSTAINSDPTSNPVAAFVNQPDTVSLSESTSSLTNGRHPPDDLIGPFSQKYELFKSLPDLSETVPPHEKTYKEKVKGQQKSQRRFALTGISSKSKEKQEAKLTFEKRTTVKDIFRDQARPHKIRKDRQTRNPDRKRYVYKIIYHLGGYLRDRYEGKIIYIEPNTEMPEIENSETSEDTTSRTTSEPTSISMSVSLSVNDSETAQPIDDEEQEIKPFAEY